MLKRTCRRHAALIVAYAALFAFVLVAPLQVEAAKKTVKLGAATVASTLYVMAGALADVFNRKNKDYSLNVTLGGGKSNPQLVGVGKSAIAYSYTYYVGNAISGKKPYKKAHPNLRGMVWLYTSAVHFMAAPELAGKGVNSFEDFVQKKPKAGITIGKKGTGTYNIGSYLFKAYGTSTDALKKAGVTVRLGGGRAMMRFYQDKHVDFVLFHTGPGNGLIKQAALRRPINFTEVTLGMRQRLEKFGLVESVVAANTYPGQKKPLNTYGLRTILFTREDQSPDLIYKVTKTVFENKDYLKGAHRLYGFLEPKGSVKNMKGVPMHPGAVRYYKEVGAM